MRVPEWVRLQFNVVIVEWKIRDRFVFNEVVICVFEESKRIFLHDPAFVAQIYCS